MNLREFLIQREKVLMEQITELHIKAAVADADQALLTEVRAAVSRPIKLLSANESGDDDAPTEYPPPSPVSIALQKFLEDHEGKVATARTEIRQDLVPLEAELAEIRGAKVAVGLRQVFKGIQRFAMAVDDFRQRLPPTSQAIDASSASDQSSPYANLTMKQLVVKALDEHFHRGATTRQLLDFFRDAWGRSIERTNLSPQLSRLYQEGTIGRIQGLKEWYLVPPERQHKRPFRVIAPVVELSPSGEILKTIYKPGDVAWLRADEVTGDHFIPEGRPVPDPDPEDD